MAVAFASSVPSRCRKPPSPSASSLVAEACILRQIQGTDTEMLGLIQVASLIESSAKKGTTELNLLDKLVDQVEWLPVSLGKLQDVTELDLSENRIMALPSTIGSLRYLTKLDLHSNQLINLPDTFGEPSSLIDLWLACKPAKVSSYINWKSHEPSLSSLLPTYQFVILYSNF
ncbi:unnamed protein product [Miscanthus lutarioriparius]|uniref:Uncharacterized protein n=1 Tax=Miscanthus lutarioriparius TaxID=422564 RepID=A0A811PKW6_9POAL|nr:unnamed protein product [Miscanthus lutarioriparius]